MKGLDQLKREIKKEASSNPEKFFATDVLKAKGFSRGQCEKCGLYFWAKNEDREICGEPECGDGYTFINNSPTEEEYTHTESWEVFQKFMEKRGYASIDRYPVVARWRDDVEFTGASIYCFQPYVVSGEAAPPADELIIPQPSLRFNDVDNVGITGRHYTNFTMIGQTCFQPPEKYDQDRYFRDMFEFTTQALGIPEEKLILHEDSWGGGGNLGACMEFFVDGLELFNQVYMFYKQTPEGYEELDLKVLDMGMGHERITWISRGTETSYESVMPETIEKMKERTGLKTNQKIWKKFLPHSSELNIDEVDDIDEKWKEIADKIDEDVDELKNEIKPAAALYSIAEHSRALLFALADGKIPSNSGGGHNLRMIYRRAQDFIEKYDWDLEMAEVAQWNAEELEPMFPELLDSIDSIQEILEVEKKKYDRSREKAIERLEKIDERPSIEEMVELYESHGVSPEMMVEHGFEVPEDFYTYVSEKDETVTNVEEDFDVEGLEETEKLYYERREPYRQDGEIEHFDFKASVEAIVDDNWIVLDRTLFYPQGGGQMHDVGKINGFQVVDVQKQSGVVLHHVPEHELSEGKHVKGVVNGEKRKQLTQHHSSTHMVNAAAREELGEHIYQAGAKKDLEKGRLDITHYEKPEKETVREIEASVRKIIENDHDINVKELAKSEAEQKYGFRIYQGGAPPGNVIRLIEIEDIDIEACGGTHLLSTENAEEFYITDVNRIQDGVIRLEYKSGKAAEEYIEEMSEILEESCNILDADTDRDLRPVLEELADIYRVEIRQLPKTLNKFRDEVKNLESKIIGLGDFLEENIDLDESETNNLIETGQDLYDRRKELNKQVEKLEDRIEDQVRDKASKGRVHEEIPTDNVGLLIQLAQQYSSQYDTTVTLVGDKGAVSASEEGLAFEELEEYSDNVQGNDSFAKAFNI